MEEKNKLPRRDCLKSNADIEHLLKKGSRVSGDCFMLAWDKAEQFQYAVLVSRKLGNAVNRNRTKRLFREAIRQNRNELQEYIKLAVLPNKKSSTATFELINAEISRVFKLVNDRL